MIRIVLVDDDVATRTSILNDLWATSDLEILAVGTNGEEAVQLTRDHRPDALLLDLDLALLDGVEVTRQLRAEGFDTRILLLTSPNDGDRLTRALDAGSDASISIEAPPTEIFTALRAAMNGPKSSAPLVPLAASAPSTSDELEVEVAHVLFMDLVNYSLQSAETQAEWSRLLTNVVHGTQEYRRATAEDELLVLPTGDGMALVFSRNPLSPVRCAVEIARAMPADGDPSLRMGAHSGVVVRMTDAAGRENVSGDGINTAQRVMSAGDPGHILVSEALAGLLASFDEWEAGLQLLGEAEVKHGVRLSLFNLSVEGAGKADRPTRLASSA